MGKALGLFAIGLVFGGGIGFTLAAGNGITFDGHDHSDPMAHGSAHAGHDMAHSTALEVPALNAPQIAVELTPDPMDGYNLHVLTKNFAFAPEAAGLEDARGQGHAHVFINNEKLGRLYGEWMHIPDLPKGEVTVKVTLNSNMHSPLAVSGQPISASSTLIVE
ncbi:hypothetical protein O4H61_15385 [Roseovarius aestuarii]|nr:hypothetical protein [Roseovarius aestuarii]